MTPSKSVSLTRRSEPLLLSLASSFRNSLDSLSPTILDSMPTPAGVILEKPVNVYRILGGFEWTVPADEDEATLTATHFRKEWFPKASKELVGYIATLAQIDVKTMSANLHQDREFPEEELEELKTALNQISRLHESIAVAVCRTLHHRAHSGHS